MTVIVLTLPIMAGKVEAWRRFCQEISGSRLEMYEVSRRRLGITREGLALIETAFGSATVTTLEAADVSQTVGQIITSALPFDCWYREQVQMIHGVNLSGYEQFVQPTLFPHNQELLFEWRQASSAGR